MMLRKSFPLGCFAIIVLFMCLRHIEKQSTNTRDPSDENCHTQAYQIPPARRSALSIRKKCAQSAGTELKQDLTQLVKEQIFVSDRYRLLFCYVPKVASSNIKRLFLFLENVVKTRELGRISDAQVNKNDKHIKILKRYSLNEINYRLRHYTKFMITREPFERLVSAYKSKFESGIQVKDKLSLDLRKNALGVLNGGTNHGSKDYLTELSFPDYIRFLVNQAKTKQRLDHHFAAQIDLCDPCNVGYDYIGTYENIDEDLPLVLNEIGADVKIPTRADYYAMHHSKLKDTKDELNEYYSKVPTTFITQLQEHLTGTDAELFGFERPDTITKIVDN